MVEHRTFNPRVVGSNPTGPTNTLTRTSRFGCMKPLLQEIVVDCADPAALATFWGTLLQARHGATDPDWAVVEAAPLFLAFQRVPEQKSSPKNRLHLDVQVDDVAAWTARAVALGASPLGEAHTDELGDGFAVLRDPEGNEFCFVVDQAGTWRARTLATFDQSRPHEVAASTARVTAPITLTPLDLPADTEALVDFLVTNTFSFHVGTQIDDSCGNADRRRRSSPAHRGRQIRWTRQCRVLGGPRRSGSGGRSRSGGHR